MAGPHVLEQADHSPHSPLPPDTPWRKGLWSELFKSSITSHLMMEQLIVQYISIIIPRELLPRAIIYVDALQVYPRRNDFFTSAEAVSCKIKSCNSRAEYLQVRGKMIWILTQFSCKKEVITSILLFPPSWLLLRRCVKHAVALYISARQRRHEI